MWVNVIIDSGVRNRQIKIVKTDCTDTMVYTACGANCVKTCENVNKSLVCTLECAPGCTCPDDTCLHEGRCVTADQCPSKYATLCNDATKYWKEII